MADESRRTKRLLPGATGLKTLPVRRSKKRRTAADDEKTEMMSRQEPEAQAQPSRDETMVRTIADVESTQVMTRHNPISSEATVFMTSPADAAEKAKKKNLLAKGGLRSFAVALAVFVIVWDTLFPEEDETKKSGLTTVAITVPAGGLGDDNPAKSQRLYEEGLRAYLLDTVDGYARASKLFSQSVFAQSANTRALAFLASSYLNVLENADKDETSILSIGKILDQVRARKVELAETVIAQVEYALLTRAYGAAEQLIADYTKNRKYELELYYYFALAKFLQGDDATAVRYLNEIPDDKIYSPRVYYLRGEIARKIGTKAEALGQYRKAIGLNPTHARSLLRIVEILGDEGKVQSTTTALTILLQHPETMTPAELGNTYFYAARLKLSEDKVAQAEEALTKAIRFQPNNSRFLLEYYGIKSDRSQSPETLRGKARMYYFLSRGEQLLLEEKPRDALEQFLRAREAYIESPAPLKRIGDTFFELAEFTNAGRSFEKAVKLAPRDLELNTRWVRALIRNYEYEEARKAIALMGRIPRSASTVFRLRGELATREERYIEALAFFKQGLGQKAVDGSIFFLYAEALYQLKQFKEALFFYALARRNGQHEVDSILGQARSRGQLEAWDEGIRFLEEEMARMGRSPAIFLVALAEMHLAKGDLPVAQKWVDQVVKEYPQNAEVWGVQARLALMSEEREPKKFLDNAIKAYSRQIELGPGNVEPRLERFKQYVRKTDYARAMQELTDIYGMYKKYPNLHFQRGNLYTLMGNTKAALEEYELELKSHPDNVNAVLALGNEYLKVKELDSALKYFTEGMRLAPKSGEPRQLAGYVQYLKKDYDAAVALLQSAADMDPGNPTVRKRLGAAYRGQGNNDKAREEFKKYLELFPDAPDRAEFEGVM